MKDSSIGHSTKHGFFFRLKRLVAVFACLAVFPWTGLTAAEFRVGIFSDWQILKPNETNRKQLREIFDRMNRLGVDAVIVAGDIAYSGGIDVYRMFRKTFDEVFASKRPELLIVMGNHDFRNPSAKTREEKYRTFMDGLGLRELNFHRTAGGFHFIGFNPDSFNGEQYSDEAGRAVQREIRDALAKSGAKPVFVISHFPAAHTVYGSANYGKGQVATFLTPFENIVFFSGHTHFPLEDERCIHQKKYTSVAAGTTSYGSLEPFFFNRNRGHIARASEVRQFLYMTVSEKEILIRRFYVHGGREIKPGSPWRISLPLRKENYRYTDARALQRTAPEFPKGAVMRLVPGKIPQEKILFYTPALHDDFVHSYALKIETQDVSGKEWNAAGKELKFCAPFYARIEKIPGKEESVAISKQVFDFSAGKRFRLSLFPVESFGKRGAPLTMEYNGSM